MANESSIAKLAVAAWRLERWLDNINVERKMAAKSALRSIKKYLQQNEIEVVDLTGSQFDVGLAVSVVNNESDETDEDKLIIREMVKPIIKEKGAVIQYGQVILGDEVKIPKANNVIDSSSLNATVEETIVMTSGIEEQPLNDKTVVKDGEERIDTNSVTPNTEEVKANNKPIFPYIAWASILLLQLVIIILLGKTYGEVGAVRQFTESSGSTKAENSITLAEDRGSIETTISDLEKTVGAISSKVNGIDSSLRELIDSSTELSQDVLKEQDTEVAQSEETTYSSDKNYITYVVEFGDTLTRICSDNGVDYLEHEKEIMELNGITDPGMIFVGQELRIPIE